MKTNTQTAHTPGPWAVDTRLTGHRYDGAPVAYYSIRHTSEFRDCYVATEIAATTLITSCGEKPNAEGQANAQLISAVPDLYEAAIYAREAVCALIDRLRAEGMESGRIRAEMTLKALDEAIAKAEGKA